MNYEDLVMEADSQGIITKEKPLRLNDGRIMNNKIAIREDIPTQVQKACVMAEELGHYYTTSGDIIDQDNCLNRKQEAKARMWAYNKMIGLNGIINAYKAKCRNTHEVAEYFGVTELFLTDALDSYRNKYGICTNVDNYVIYFEPHLYVADMNF